MAKTEKDILISLKLDNKDFEKNVDATKKGLESLGKQIQMTQKFLGAAKEGTKQYQQLSETLKNQQAVFEKLNSSINKTDESSKSLKAQLREMKNRLGELDEGSDEFIALQKEAGKLQDRISDLNSRVKTFSSETQGLDAGIEAISVVAAGFGAVQGSMAALGIESESVEKTLTKLSGITTLLNSLQVIQNTLKDQSILKTLLQDKVTKGLAATQTFLARTFALSSTAARTFGKALIGTGIGALVVGLGLLIANFDKVYSWIEKTIPSITTFGNAVKEIAYGITDFFGITSAEERKASEQLKKDIASNNKILKDNEEFLRYNAKKVDEFTKKKIEAKSEYVKKNNELLQAEEKGEITTAERIRLMKQEDELLNQTLADADKEREKEAKERRAEAYKKFKEDLEKRQQALKDYRDKITSTYEQVEDLRIDLMQDGMEKEKAIVFERQKDNLEALDLELIELKKNANFKEEDLKVLEEKRKLIVEQGRRDIKNIEDKYDKESAQKLEESFDKEIEKLSESAEKKKEFIDIEVKDEKQKQKQILAIELDTAKQVLDILQDKANADNIITQEEIKAIQDAQHQVAILTGKMKELNSEKDKPFISEEQKEQIDVAIEGVTTAIGIIGDAFAQSFANQNQAIDQNTKKQIDSINESGLTEMQKERQIAKVEEENAKKKYALQVEEFNFNKGMQIAQAIINGAQAVLAILSVPDFTFGVMSGIRLGIAAATTAASIGIISAQQPPPPPFFKGGYTGDGNPRDVSVQLGKKNYTYHKGEYVVPNRILMSPDGSKLVNQLESMRTSNSTSMGMNGFADGGFTSSQMSSSVQMQMQGQMISSMVTDAIKNVQIVTRVTDINRINKNLAQTKAKATLR